MALINHIVYEVITIMLNYVHSGNIIQFDTFWGWNATNRME